MRKWVLLCAVTSTTLWRNIAPVGRIYIPAAEVDNHDFLAFDDYYTSIFGAHSHTYYGLEVILKVGKLSDDGELRSPPPVSRQCPQSGCFDHRRQSRIAFLSCTSIGQSYLQHGKSR